MNEAEAREIVAIYPAEDTHDILRRRVELFYKHAPDTDTSYTWELLLERASGVLAGIALERERARVIVSQLEIVMRYFVQSKHPVDQTLADDCKRALAQWKLGDVSSGASGEGE